MNKTDLYIIGLGIKGLLHLTVEAIQALKVCRCVYVLHHDLSVVEGLRNYCDDVVDLEGLFKKGGSRDLIYREISSLMISKSKEQPKIAFVTHGHPLFLVSASEYMVKLGKKSGLNVRILPGISSFDTILCDLEIDFGHDAQIFDASTFLRECSPIHARIPAIFFNISSCLNYDVMFDDPNSEILKPLVNVLIEIFGVNHICKLVHSASHVLEKSVVEEVTLENLLQDPPIPLWLRPTLYVPARLEHRDNCNNSE